MAAAALIVGATVAPHAGRAQQMPPGITRTELQRHDIEVPGREIVHVRIDFAPGASVGLHTHPGEEVIYILTGEIEYNIAGKPLQKLKAGDVLLIPPGTIHAARNVGTGPATELSVYVVKKGEPLVSFVK